MQASDPRRAEPGQVLRELSNVSLFQAQGRIQAADLWQGTFRPLSPERVADFEPAAKESAQVGSRSRLCTPFVQTGLQCIALTFHLAKPGVDLYSCQPVTFQG
ncbi:hypothetical protein D3C79_444220 [compost metagenome]